MTTAPQPKPIPIPALLVYGKPTSPELPQASWFPAEDRPTVVAAAQSLKFSVLDIRTEAEKALIVGVHEGVLKGNSRMIVGSVTLEVFKRIEEYVAKASPAPVARAASIEEERAKLHQNKTRTLVEKELLRHQPQRPRRRRQTSLPLPTPGPRSASVRTSPRNIGTAMARPMVGG